MGNILKDIFSEDEHYVESFLTFANKKDMAQYENAMKTFMETGSSMDIHGVKAIGVSVHDGDRSYPIFSQSGKFSKFVISPHYEEVTYPVATKLGERQLSMRQSATAKSFIMESLETAIFYIKLIHPHDSDTLTMHYSPRLHLAKSIDEILEASLVTRAFLDNLFLPEAPEGEDEGFLHVTEMRRSLFSIEEHFTMIKALEKDLELSFQMDKILVDDSSILDVTSLYLLLLEKKVLRLEAKLSSTASTSVTIADNTKTLVLAKPIELTFLGTDTYSLYGESITIHTANYLGNATIREILQNEDGTSTCLYGDRESSPMYISYSAFLTEEEAKTEMESIMDKRDSYVSAIGCEEFSRNREGDA